MESLQFSAIHPLDESLLCEAQSRLDQLTKPQGSLGELEEIAKRLFAIYGSRQREIRNKAIFVLAGDHGIVREGVSAYPQEVTRQMLANFVEGGAAISVLAHSLGARLFVADFGVMGERHPQPIADKKVRQSTRNFLYEDAMTQEEALRAIKQGMTWLEELHQKHHFDLIALGEMGIGNSTSSAAMIAALTGESIRSVTGRGTGLNPDLYEKKISVLEQALRARNPRGENPLEVLSKVGGYEIAGLAGLYLEAARLKIPCIIDGLISSAAALCAWSFAPHASHYFFASHLSCEPGHKKVLDCLKLSPLIHAGMRLGEGSGAALAFPILESAWNLFCNMATFESAGVSSKDK
ncbi:MAG: nicotinate-nucleotide--dimethylbenzimidazole phosphoribosyltransferase [Candidatus Omnitrophica bacterium]|nr:nicotinate-nucleotide--dimethylbenzimidazole phosphoribosyltransferase [Candidatus Omnitrophota bacterium]